MVVKDMKRKILTILVVLLTFINGLYAQEQADSIFKDSLLLPDETKQIEDNIDSLMNNWFVQKSLNLKQEASVDLDTLISNLPDSVYINRLNQLSSYIPLKYNEKVRNFINMYAKRKGQLQLMLGLTPYYFPLFEEKLDAKQLPLELKYLPVIESALNPRAVSRVGATGLWQFMYGTGRMYGLKINSYIDERRDPLKSTEAAVNYLSDLNDIYHDWVLVIAAYNCGPGNVNKAIRRSGGKRDFWDIYYYLPRETRGYVPAFIAATYLMNFYQEHYIQPDSVDMPLATDTLIIDHKVHFEQIAHVLNIPLQMIRDLNPQYRRDIVPATPKNKLSLKLPMDNALSFIDLKDSIYAYKDSIYLNPKIEFEAAPKYSYSHYSGGRGSYYYSYTPPSIKNKKKVYYTVKSGDAISLIAKWFNVRSSDIKYWNKMRTSRIRVGQKLAIYVPKSKASYYASINNMSSTKKNALFGTGASSPVKRVVKKDPNYIYYTVRRGDNLWIIAKRFPGVSDSDIMRINGLTSSGVQHLQPGDVLKIKRKGS